MNLRSSVSQNTDQANGKAPENASDRFMIVVPEALHSFPVCRHSI